MKLNRSVAIPARGFTLVEIVIAISILAIIMAMAFQAITTIVRSRELITATLDEETEAQNVLSRLTRELQLATQTPGKVLLPPPDSLGSNTGTSSYFRNESTSLQGGVRSDIVTFVAKEGGQYFPDGTRRGGYVQLSYRLAENPDEQGGLLLIREEVPLIYPPEKAYEQALRFPISDKVRGLELKLFRKQTSQWLDTWGDTTTSGIPDMIQLSVIIQVPSGQFPNGRPKRYTTAVLTQSK